MSHMTMFSQPSLIFSTLTKRMLSETITIEVSKALLLSYERT